MSRKIETKPNSASIDTPIWKGRRWMTLIPESSKAQSIILKVKPPGGRWHKVLMQPSDLVRTSRAVDAIVNETGCTAGSEQLKGLIEAIAETGGGGTRTVTFRSGRRGDVFVTPSRTIQLAKGAKRSIVFDSGRVARNPALAAVGRRNGSLVKWKRNVAECAGYSSLGIIVIGAALSPSLLDLSELSESFLLNLAGRSSGGKTILTLVAMSVQGAASRGDIVPPGFTVRALEELGVGFHELLMPIDDLSRITDTKEVRQTSRFLAYHFSDGGGRVVSDPAMQKGLPFERFRSIGLMSYEQSSAEIARLSGVERRPGETVRMLDLVSDPLLGVFDRIPKSETRTPERIAKNLEDAVRANFGVALPAFLKWLHKTGDAAVEERVRKLIADFAELVTSGDDAVQRRAAQKFGLIYAALILAKSAQVTPWSSRVVRKVLARGFAGALSAVSAPVSGAQLFDRFRELIARPGLVLEVGPEGKVEGLDSRWVVARGLLVKGRPMSGLRMNALTPYFPSLAERDRLLEELIARRITTVAAGKTRWLARLKEGDRVQKCRLVLMNEVPLA